MILCSLIEYYTEEWLQKASYTLGMTIKVDDTKLATSRGRFAHACVEINMDKPLVASYRMRGIEGQLQYEDLQDLCFTFGKYGHKEVKCPLTFTKATDSKEDDSNATASKEEADREETGSKKTVCGPWMVAQKNRRQLPRGQRGNLRILKRNIEGHAAGDKGVSPSSKEKDPLKATEIANGQPIFTCNQGLRFSMLEDQMDIETATAGATNEEDNGVNHGGDLAGDEAGEEVVMKTKEDVDAEGGRVCVNVSHSALADSLRPMEKVRMSIRSQAQVSSGGPRKTSESMTPHVL